MSLCSCSSCSAWSESRNSYCLLSSSSSSITTVSSQLNNEQQNLITDDEQWPDPPIEITESNQNIVQNNWQIKKNVNLKDQKLTKTGCILKATMTKEQILICDSLSSQFTIIPGKHISMKVVFNF